MAAGHETTVYLIGNGLVAFLDNPDQFDKLKENPDLINSAVEEILRYSGSVEINQSRFIGEDFELYGQQLKKGDMLITVFGSADRDDRVFENPDKFDITRNPNKHIAFGFGLHSCLGAPLARLETRIAIATIAKRYPNIKLGVDSSELELRSAFVSRGFEKIPVKL